MKLLKSLTNLNNGILKFINFFLVSIFFFAACENKLPTKNSDTNILTFDSIKVGADKLQFSSKSATYYTGKDGKLYIGENEQLKTVSLMKFPTMQYLPDTLEKVLDLTLSLVTSEGLPIDTNVQNNNKLNLYLIDEPVDWTEEETTYNINNLFSFETMNKIPLLKNIELGSQDTCVIDLLEADFDLVNHWLDSTNAEGGLILELVKDGAASHQFQSIYSSNSVAPPEIYVNYINGGDTIDVGYEPNDDLTAPARFNNSEMESWSVSEIYNKALLLNFDLGELFNPVDSNIYIPEAQLKLHIDADLTENYSDNFGLYVSLIDTNNYYDDYIYDISQTSDAIVVNPEDSVVVIDMDMKLQGYVSGYRDNYGIAIWASYLSNDIAKVTFLGNDAEENLKPELKVLYAKEEK